MTTSQCNPGKRPVTIIVECEVGFENDAREHRSEFLKSLALPDADWGQPQVVEVIPGASFSVFDLPLVANAALLAAREWRCRFERRGEVVFFFINDVGLAAYAKNCGEADIASLPVTIVGLSVEQWRGKSTPTGLQVLPSLTSLDLSDCESLRDLNPIANSTQLTNLNLSSCESLTDLSPIANLTQLTSLDLYSCESLTDLSQTANLTQLTSLNLSSCESLTDLSPIANLTQLTSLDLSSCKFLTDLSPIANLTQLTSLDLSSCESLTDLSPTANLTQLTSLNLSSCPYIMSAFRLKPVLDLPCLQELSLDAPDLRSFVLLQSACARNDAAAISSCIREIDLIDILQRTEYSRELVGALARSIGIAGRSLPAHFASNFLDQCLQLATLSGESWHEILREVARGDSASLASWLQGLRAAAGLPDALLSGLLDFIARGGEVESVGWPELLDVLLEKPSRDQQIELGPQICLAWRTLGDTRRETDWLKRLTDPGDSGFVDKVQACFALHDLAKGDTGEAVRWLAARPRHKTIEADQLRIGLARALARKLPDEAGKYLEAAFDETDRVAMSEELSLVPEFTASEANLQRLTVILGPDPERFHPLLDRMLRQHPDSDWIRHLRRELSPPAEAGVTRALMHVLGRQDVLDLAGKKRIQTLQDELLAQPAITETALQDAAIRLLERRGLVNPSEAADLRKLWNLP